MSFKLPKLNLVCSKDEMKPVMNHVYIDVENNNVVATNAHMMVIHKIEDLFKDLNVSFDTECYIPAEDWTELTKPFERLEMVEGYMMVHRKKGAPIAVRLIKIKEIGKYPSYLKVLPYEGKPLERSYFTVNPELLLNLCKAMTNDLKPVSFTNYENTVALSFDPETIKERLLHEESVRAFIMKCKDTYN